MKLFAHPIALLLVATSVLSALSGCNSPGDARPNEVRPGVTRRPGLKGPQSAIPITVVKVVPTPTPLAKGKKPTVRRKFVNVPADTSMPFDFSVASEFWPTGVESVAATIKCYQVASVYVPNTGGYAITTTGSPLPVFGDSSTSKNITITPSGPTTVFLTFSSGSCADKQLMVGITGTGEDGDENIYDFGGGEIFVVSQ